MTQSHRRVLIALAKRKRCFFVVTPAPAHSERVSGVHRLNLISDLNVDSFSVFNSCESVNALALAGQWGALLLLSRLEQPVRQKRLLRLPDVQTSDIVEKGSQRTL
jgi:hypothetical protein